MMMEGVGGVERKSDLVIWRGHDTQDPGVEEGRRVGDFGMLL